MVAEVAEVFRQELPCKVVLHQPSSDLEELLGICGRCGIHHGFSKINELASQACVEGNMLNFEMTPLQDLRILFSALI